MAAPSRRAKLQDLTAEQRSVLSQRRLVTAFLLVFLGCGIVGELLPWVDVSYGTTVLGTVKGTGTNAGMVALASFTLALIATLANLLDDAERDHLVTVPCIAAAVAMLWFGSMTLSDEVLKPIVNEAERDEGLRQLMTSKSSEIKVTFRAGLYMAIVAALNIVLASGYLLLLHPRLDELEEAPAQS